MSYSDPASMTDVSCPGPVSLTVSGDISIRKPLATPATSLSPRKIEWRKNMTEEEIKAITPQDENTITGIKDDKIYDMVKSRIVADINNEIRSTEKDKDTWILELGFKYITNEHTPNMFLEFLDTLQVRSKTATFERYRHTKHFHDHLKSQKEWTDEQFQNYIVTCCITKLDKDIMKHLGLLERYNSIITKEILKSGFDPEHDDIHFQTPSKSTRSQSSTGAPFVPVLPPSPTHSNNDDDTTEKDSDRSRSESNSSFSVSSLADPSRPSISLALMNSTTRDSVLSEQRTPKGEDVLSQDDLATIVVNNRPSVIDIDNPSGRNPTAVSAEARPVSDKLLNRRTNLSISTNISEGI